MGIDASVMGTEAKMTTDTLQLTLGYIQRNPSLAEDIIEVKMYTEHTTSLVPEFDLAYFNSSLEHLN